MGGDAESAIPQFRPVRQMQLVAIAMLSRDFFAAIFCFDDLVEHHIRIGDARELQPQRPHGVRLGDGRIFAANAL
jgi:hypothetical protein